MFSDRCDGCPCPTIRAHFLHPSRQCLAQPPLHAVYTNRGSDNTYATMLYVNSSLPCTELRPTANCCCLFFYMRVGRYSQEAQEGGNNKILVAGDIIRSCRGHVAIALACRWLQACLRVRQSTPYAASFFATPAKCLPCITRGEGG